MYQASNVYFICGFAAIGKSSDETPIQRQCNFDKTPPSPWKKNTALTNMAIRRRWPLRL